MGELIRIGEEWVDDETGQIYTQEELNYLSDKRILQAHTDYCKRSIEYGTEINYHLVKLSNKESNKMRVKERYKFNMMHRTDLREIMASDKLSLKEVGFIGRLTPFICFPDNDVKINNQYLTLEELAKFVGFSKNIMTKVIKVLENEEIIKVVKGGNKPPIIYFNPFLYSAGREVSKDTYMMFAKSKYNPDLKYYIDK